MGFPSATLLVLPPYPNMDNSGHCGAGAGLNGEHRYNSHSQTTDCQGIRDNDCCPTLPQNVPELAIKLVINIRRSCFFHILSLFLLVI